MHLKVYHDSSRDDNGITLCGVAATESVWQELEFGWSAVLQRHRISALHMTDLMGFFRLFSRRHGWDEARRRTLLMDLMNVVGRFRAAPHHLLARSCTVITDDWSLAKVQLPMLPSPEAMCVNFCVGSLYLPPECSNEEKPVFLYFDRNEKFMHTVRRVWEKRRKQAGKFSHIATVETVAADQCGVQVADLLAWVLNRRAPHQEPFFLDTLRLASILMIEHPSVTYDLERILDRYPNGTLKPGPKNC